MKFSILSIFLSFALYVFIASIATDPIFSKDLSQLSGIALAVDIFIAFPISIGVFFIGSSQAVRSNKNFAYVLATLNVIYIPVFYSLIYFLTQLDSV